MVDDILKSNMNSFLLLQNKNKAALLIFDMDSTSKQINSPTIEGNITEYI